MIIVTGIIELAEADVEAAKAAVTVMVAETLKEAGCHVYEFSQIVGSGTKFRVYEEWADAESLQAHFETEHMAQFRQALASINVTSSALDRFEAVGREPL